MISNKALDKVDLRFRKPALYPTELRGLVSNMLSRLSPRTKLGFIQCSPKMYALRRGSSVLSLGANINLLPDFYNEIVGIAG
jgi:hypothetical protein